MSREPQPERISVVLIDDSADVRYLIAVTMQLDGRFDIVGEAEEAAEGLEVVRTHDPDLVIVDLQLGRRSGHWLLRQLRSAGSVARLAVVTASSDPADHLRARDEGADLVLDKHTLTTTLLDDLASLWDEGVGTETR